MSDVMSLMKQCLDEVEQLRKVPGGELNSLRSELRSEFDVAVTSECVTFSSNSFLLCFPKASVSDSLQTL